MDDITDTLAPKSDQLDGIDLAATGPRIFTIESVDVTKGSEQPVVIRLAEFDRPWKPAVTMRRVLATCWGVKSSAWVGNRVELYYEPDVTYGKDKPGGTRVLRLSGIDKRTDVDVMLTRGRMGKYRVDPLPDAPKPSTRQPLPSRIDVDECTDTDQLNTWAAASGGERKAYIDARIAALAPDPHAADIAAPNAENEAQE